MTHFWHRRNDVAVTAQIKPSTEVKCAAAEQGQYAKEHRSNHNCDGQNYS